VVCNLIHASTRNQHNVAVCIMGPSLYVLVAVVFAAEYRDLFNAFDREHKGSVSIADLLAVSQQLGLPSNQADLDQMLIHSNIDRTYANTHNNISRVK